MDTQVRIEPRHSANAFVGRERELAEHHAGLDDVSAGHGLLFLLSGEPGIGKTRLADEFARLAAVFSVALWIALAATVSAADMALGWDPSAFRDQSTLQIMTTGPEEGEHWSRLWLVVIDGQLYIRLGDRAFGRVQKNVASPYVKVKISGTEFDRVRLDAAPDMTDKVAAAMAEKYFMDILIRHESHPMTARLTAEAPPSAPSN